jgi:2'-5' RNA ligase
MIEYHNKNKIRSFIAIEIPGDLRAKIETIQKELQNKKADVKWVLPGGIHLTLKFLGEITAREVESISNILDSIIPSWKAFPLRIKGVGCFPSIRNPRIIWLGIDEGASMVSTLQKAIERSAIEQGFSAEDRPFRPHLTLGRVRSKRGLEYLIQAIENLREVEVGTFKAQEVSLFRSDLKPSGAVYTQLRGFRMFENS